MAATPPEPTKHWTRAAYVFQQNNCCWRIAQTTNYHLSGIATMPFDATSWCFESESEARAAIRAAETDHHHLQNEAQND